MNAKLTLTKDELNDARDVSGAHNVCVKVWREGGLPGMVTVNEGDTLRVTKLAATAHLPRQEN